MLDAELSCFPIKKKNECTVCYSKNIKHRSIVGETSILFLKILLNFCWYFLSKLLQIIRMNPSGSETVVKFVNALTRKQY